MPFDGKEWIRPLPTGPGLNAVPPVRSPEAWPSSDETIKVLRGTLDILSVQWGMQKGNFFAGGRYCLVGAIARAAGIATGSPRAWPYVKALGFSGPLDAMSWNDGLFVFSKRRVCRRISMAIERLEKEAPVTG